MESGHNSNPINLDNEMEDSQTVEFGSKAKSNKWSKSQTSDVWQSFTKIGVADDGIQRASCNGCKTLYKCGINDGKDYGTSHLRRHREKCTKIKFGDVGQMIMDKEGKLTTRKIDPMVVRDMIGFAIIEHDLPFKFAEFRRIRSLINYLNPDFNPISRNTTKADIMKIYAREKEGIKKEMCSIPTRISLTSDLWTACTTEGYICLTAHYVDLNWKLTSKIINFCHMPPPHTGVELSKKILEFLNEWGIDKKIFSITLDNAASNVVMQEQLKNKLIVENSLLCDGEFFHVRCSAHILNLIVQEGLKVSSETLHKIRESIKYVKGYESRMLKFKICIEKLGGVDISAGLCQDVPTRWNSTYLMLESALKYKNVFEKLHLYDDNYRLSPSVEEWKRAEKIHMFLMPFYVTTNLISGTSYPTSNLYFMQVWKIQCVLLDTLRDEDEVLRIMAGRMVTKFEKYWDEYSVVLAMGAILDPRVKLETLRYCFERIDGTTSETKLQVVKSNLCTLFDQYRSIGAPTFVQNISQTPTSVALQKQSTSQDLGYVFDELDRHKTQLAKNTGKSQLDLYLEEPSLSFKDNSDLDVLQWWKENKSRFLDLSIMDRDLLSIPITTVASESAFSIGSHVLNKYRSRLLSKNVEALVCARNWLNGFVCEDDDEDLKDDDSSRSEKVDASSSNRN